jgi:hypothetical protein
LTSHLKPTQDEVLRRVGRNLLLFQQIEHFLKFLLSTHKSAGTADTLKTNLQEQAEGISKKMLGQLVAKYATEVLKDSGEEVPEEEGPADWFKFSFSISGDTEFVESMRRDLKVMTDQRNELVHHFLQRWQPDSPEKMAEALTYLDSQREKVLSMHEHLRSTIGHIQESRKKLLDFMTSPEYEKQSELMWLQASPLVSFLSEVTTKIHRKDGWCYLTHAGELAAKELSEELKNLKEHYGFKTLKKLVIGSELFDVLDEILLGGGFRTLYRLRPTQEPKIGAGRRGATTMSER